MHTYNIEKMHAFLRGYGSAGNMPQTLCALAFARKMHEGANRRDGQPYIVHPLTMACDAISMGIHDDNIIAATLLHDVIEDCDVSLADLPVNDQVRDTVRLLTFQVRDGETKPIALNRYYTDILDSHDAVIIKLLDRCHNVSSMAGTFSRDKLNSYIDETRTYVLPMLRKAKDRYPNDADLLFLMKYHILSVIDSIEATIQAYSITPQCCAVYCERKCVNRITNERGVGFCGLEAIAVTEDGICGDYNPNIDDTEVNSYAQR